MGLELELKYLLGAAYAPQVAELLNVYAKAGASEEVALLNAYFDTPDHWFRRHDMGLRTRQKHGRFEQTIKLAGQQHGALQIRPEYNLPCAAIVPVLADFPAEIWPAATDLTTIQQQLTELFSTDFVRQSWRLVLPNATIEVVYDKGEVRAGERRQVISEIEIELLTGEPAAVFDLAEFLLNALPMRTGWLSKAARGYQLYQNTTTPRPAALPSTAQPALALAAHLQRLQQLENCFLQELAPELLSEAAQELQWLANALTDEGQQLLASDARTLARKLSEEGGVVFNNQAYHSLLLKISRLLLKHP